MRPDKAKKRVNECVLDPGSNDPVAEANSIYPSMHIPCMEPLALHKTTLLAQSTVETETIEL